MEAQCVLCEVRTEFLHIVWGVFKFRMVEGRSVVAICAKELAHTKNSTLAAV
jgi:hypothetical protein